MSVKQTYFENDLGKQLETSHETAFFYAPNPAIMLSNFSIQRDESTKLLDNQFPNQRAPSYIDYKKVICIPISKQYTLTMCVEKILLHILYRNTSNICIFMR